MVHVSNGESSWWGQRGTFGGWVIPVNKDVEMAEWIALAGCMQYRWQASTADLMWLILSDRKLSSLLKVTQLLCISPYSAMAFISSICHYKYMECSR